MQESENQIRRKFRQLKMIAKYGIFGMLVLGTVHCFLLWLGKDVMAIHILAVLFASALGIALNRLFGLCWAHKLAVAYICLLLLCIVLRRHGMFSNYASEHRLGMMLAGIAISLILLWKGRKNS